MLAALLLACAPALASERAAPQPQPQLARAIAPASLPGLSLSQTLTLAPAAAEDAARPLEPALVWPLSGEGSARVRTLGFSGGAYLIDGAEAPTFREPQLIFDGVAKRTLLHPDDETLLVTVYESPRSLGAFHEKSARLERLLPLSEAGAAPRLVEHGEALVPGKGRVHFIAREKVEAVALGDLEPAARPQGAVEALLDRLRDSGLGLEVPARSSEWLLSRVVIEAPAGGEPKAYLLGAEARPLSGAALAAHDSMVRALMRSALKLPKQERPLAAPPREAYVEPEPEAPPQAAAAPAAAGDAGAEQVAARRKDAFEHRTLGMAMMGILPGTLMTAFASIEHGGLSPIGLSLVIGGLGSLIAFSLSVATKAQRAPGQEKALWKRLKLAGLTAATAFTAIALCATATAPKRAPAAAAAAVSVQLDVSGSMSSASSVHEPHYRGRIVLP